MHGVAGSAGARESVVPGGAVAVLESWEVPPSISCHIQLFHLGVHAFVSVASTIQVM